MMNSEISGRWLDNFRRITNIWLAFWRGIGRFLPDSLVEKWVFFWKNIGYGLPSSRFLIARLLKYVPWNTVGNIVELGGGTGVVTRAILAQKKDETILTSCEIQKDRYDNLQVHQNEHTNILHMDAQACLKNFAHESVDVVISTLPLGSIQPMHVREILEATAQSLKAEGVFIQYQYFASNKEDIEKYFTIETIDWEPINFPPAFVYVCRKR